MKKPHWIGLSLVTACTAMGPSAACAAEERKALSPADLSRMSLEDLANVEISSVSKRPERLNDAAAAIYVITRDDIRRSGFTSLPEILRLAPNLHVARIDASQYAISARGFNLSTANKLLVLIDGRSVYTPLFSGVFWDAQDTLVEDIERIEVISGPGGTLWGANAVNGVINVITRNARDTQGTLASLAAGSRESNAAVRFGGAAGEAASFRLYAKAFEREGLRRASGATGPDEFRARQAGFRVDGGPAANGYTVQGDTYEGSVGQNTGPRGRISGANLLARWSRALADGAVVQVHGYLDHGERDLPGSFGERRNTFDLEAQHNFAWRGSHRVVWGGGYRRSRDAVSGGTTLVFLPARSTLTLANVFAQDTIELTDRWRLTVGLKAEHNNYTGMEYQPNARLAWKPSEDTLLWSSLSRAVRTPSRLDRDLFSPGTPPFNTLQGGPDFQSEKLDALELGYRGQVAQRWSWSATAFHHRYRDLRSLESVGASRLPAVIGNEMEGHAHGVELWANWQVADWWRLSAGYVGLHKHLRLKPGSRDVGGVQGAGNDPEHRSSLRSAMNLGTGQQLDITVRSVSALPNPAIPSYVGLDVRWARQLSKALELSVTASNLLDRGHPEFGPASTRAEVPRNLLVKLLWTP